MPTLEGNELHESGPNGKKQDKRLHEEILGGVSEEHVRKHRQASRLRASKLLDKPALDRLYGEEN